MRHNYLGTEHVVIALAADGSPVQDVFATLGITDRLLRQQIERLLANPWTTQHVEPEAADNTALDRPDSELQRLSAELARFKRGT